MRKIFAIGVLIPFLQMLPVDTQASAVLWYLWNSNGEEERRREEEQRQHDLKRAKFLKEFHLLGSEVQSKINRRLMGTRGNDVLKGTHLREAFFLTSGRDTIHGGTGWHIYIVDGVKTEQTAFVDQTIIYDESGNYEIPIYFSEPSSEYKRKKLGSGAMVLESDSGLKIKLINWNNVKYKLIFSKPEKPSEVE